MTIGHSRVSYGCTLAFALLLLLFIFWGDLICIVIYMIILITCGFIFFGNCFYVWVAIWLAGMYVRVFVLVLDVLPREVSIRFVVGSVVLFVRRFYY